MIVRLRSAWRRLVRVLLYGAEESIASAIYGSIVAMAVIVAGSVGGRGDPVRLGALVFASSLALWVAHVYAHGVAASVSERHRLELGSLGHIARRELGLVTAAVLPALFLALSGWGLASYGTSLRLALGAGTLTLAVQGLRYGRARDLGRLGTLVAVLVNAGIGLGVVALEVFVAH